MNNTADPQFTISILTEKVNSDFYDEYTTIQKTIESTNNFAWLYKAGRLGAKGGPSTHVQQDIYRAMLVFACAGLDIFVKQLVVNKLPQLVEVDQGAKDKFTEYLRKGLSNKDLNGLAKILALTLADHNPREVLLHEYIKSMTDNSMQSVERLITISDASGLDTIKIFTKQRIKALKDAFDVRNEIIHEMDINISDKVKKGKNYRTRIQRVYSVMSNHATIILDTAQELFKAYKNHYLKYNLGTKQVK